MPFLFGKSDASLMKKIRTQILFWEIRLEGNELIRKSFWIKSIFKQQNYFSLSHCPSQVLKVNKFTKKVCKVVCKNRILVDNFIYSDKKNSHTQPTKLSSQKSFSTKKSIHAQTHFVIFACLQSLYCLINCSRWFSEHSLTTLTYTSQYHSKFW